MGRMHDKRLPNKNLVQLRRKIKKEVYKGNSLKVPEKYEKCPRVSSSVKGKPLPTPPRGREWATS